MRCYPKNIITFSLVLLFSLISLSQAINSISFNLTKVDSVPEDIIWCGPKRDVIFLLTENNSLYKSTDKGFSWENLNSVLIQEAKNHMETPGTKIGDVSKMLQSPLDPSLIVFLGTEGFSWIIEDCYTIQALLHGRPISEYIFHPTVRNWGLASAFSLCEDYVSEPCRIVKELYVTFNLGSSWKILGDYIHQFSWGVKSKEQIKKGVPKERILVSYQPRGRGHQDLNKKWDYRVDFAYSDDFFNTKIVAVRKGNRFLLTEKYLYVSQVIDQENEEVQLLHSPATSKRYEFTPIVTNQQSYKEHSYTFLDTSEDMVFLYINNFGRNAKFGNIYASGDQGKMFSLSLKNNIQLQDYSNDFETIKSTEGVYLANAVSGKYIKLARKEIENAGTAGNLYNKKTKVNYMDYVKTLITHNKGGDWKRLNAPKVDSNNDTYDCGDYCYLHLFSYSSEIPQFYSVDSAPGIIIGNGNIGRYLDYGYRNISLFLSRDGGINWFEIKKGVYIYEIGDHGGLIVIGKFNQPTKEIMYTYDEGLTWESEKIVDENILIKNILIEPSSSGQNFLVYGTLETKGENKGVIINLGFESLNIPICSRRDYEQWTPKSSKEGQSCLLGRKVTYSRRKRDSKCLNGEGFTRLIQVENCYCTEDDYQCDIGFHRDEPGDPCTPIKKNSTDINKPPEQCEGYYTISKGYRKVAGNFCKGGVNLDPIKMACPYNKVLYTAKIIIITIIVIVLIVFVISLFNNNKNEMSALFEGMWNIITNIKQSFGGIPENYLNIDNVDEDNMVFDDDNEKGNTKKETKKDKEEDKEDKNLINDEKINN